MNFSTIGFHDFEYLLVLILVFLPTFLLSFHPGSDLKGKRRIVFLSSFLVGIPFILWDMWATVRGHWAFNPDFTLGLYVFNLPIEEILFFICIPFSCTYVW